MFERSMQFYKDKLVVSTANDGLAELRIETGNVKLMTIRLAYDEAMDLSDWLKRAAEEGNSIKSNVNNSKNGTAGGRKM
jgi:hypothetical protein